MTDSMQTDSTGELAALRRRVVELEKQLAGQQDDGQKTELQQIGSGGIAQGSDNKATGERGIITQQIGRDVITGDNNSITYIVQQARREDKAIDEEHLRRQIVDYLIWVRERFGTIELRGVHREGQQVVRLELETVYVPLAATTYDKGLIRLNNILEQGQQLIITGGPGSGKTTVLQHIAWVLASAILQNKFTLAHARLSYKDSIVAQIKEKIRRLQDVNPTSQIREKERSGKEQRTKEINRQEDIFASTLDQLYALIQSRFITENPLRKHIEHIYTRVTEHIRTDPSSIDILREVWLQKGLATALDLAEYTENLIALPIFVPLSSYAQERRKLKAAQERTLAAFITQYLIEKQSGLNLPPNFFTSLLGSGHNIILLLDGLDEVPDEQDRAAVREAIENLVTGRENMRVVVTCRTAAYRGRTALGREFREIQVKSLDEEHIANLVRQAYRAFYANNSNLWQAKTDEILRGISDLEMERRRRLGENVDRLVDSPLLVRMLLMVHLSERRLPEHRAELYMRATDTMLWPEHALDEEAAQHIGRLVGGTHESHRELVQHLAFDLHTRGPQQGREIEEGDIRRVLSEVPEFKPLIDNFLALTRLRGTLLEERMGVYRFIHLAFQEYLVARYLAEVKRSEGGVEAIARFLEEGPIGEAWWREPTLLVVGYLTLTAPRAASQLLRRLVGIVAGEGVQLLLNPDARFIAAQLALTACQEWLPLDEALRRDLAEGSVALLRNVNLSRHSQPRHRANLGDTLAKFGDPRFNANSWYLPAEPLLGFIEIPAGPFFMGRNTALEENVKKWEQPQHELMLPTYYINRYPVTVAQFHAFCESSGYNPQNPRSLHDPLTRPVRYVTWHDALRYCMWLTETLRAWADTPEPLSTLLRCSTDGSSPWIITLPSEAEWEKAARGRDMRIYPWGNDPIPNVMNCRETSLKTTSAIGCFSASVSPYGVEELAGNTWEWTRSLWGKDWNDPDFAYPYNPTDGRENLNASDQVLRVLRGGSWAASMVGCGVRYCYSPYYIGYVGGFRAVVSSLTLTSE